VTTAVESADLKAPTMSASEVLMILMSRSRSFTVRQRPREQIVPTPTVQRC